MKCVTLAAWEIATPANDREANNSLMATCRSGSAGCRGCGWGGGEGGGEGAGGGGGGLGCRGFEPIKKKSALRLSGCRKAHLVGFSAGAPRLLSPAFPRGDTQKRRPQPACQSRGSHARGACMCDAAQPQPPLPPAALYLHAWLQKSKLSRSLAQGKKKCNRVWLESCVLAICAHVRVNASDRESESLRFS